jgi:4-hydroxy-3-methylbut-2-enyl diphosphate reductase
VHVVTQPSDVDALALPRHGPVAVLAQTTLAVTDWAAVADHVRKRFSSTWTPPRDDICFATTNRQSAARALACEVDVILVVGSRTSSNTAAIVATSLAARAREVHLVRGVEDLPTITAESVGVIGGASTPAATIDAVVHALAPTSVRKLHVVDETEYFPLAAGVRRQIEAAIATGSVPRSLVDAYRNDRNVPADALITLVEHSIPLLAEAR